MLLDVTVAALASKGAVVYVQSRRAITRELASGMEFTIPTLVRSASVTHDDTNSLLDDAHFDLLGSPVAKAKGKSRKEAQ